MAYKINIDKTLEWDRLIADYRSSGKTGATWCEEHGFKIHQLRFQITKRSNQAGNNKIPKASFIPLEVISEKVNNSNNNTSNNNTSITVSIGQALIHIEEGFPPSLLAEVIKTLQPLC